MMANLARHFVWAIALTGCVVSIAYWTSVYNVEDVKQRAFMMKACTDAGGQWTRNGWVAAYECLRPGSRP